MTETMQSTLAEGAAAAARTYEARAYAASGTTSRLAPATIRRRAPRPQDVQLEVLFCGVCHSDLHQVRNEWQSVMPTVPAPGGARRPLNVFVLGANGATAG